MQGSNRLRCDIYTECDSRVGERAFSGLSRTAQRGVFALWIIASGAIGGVACLDRSKRLATCSRPAGRMNARTADYAGAWLQETDWLETARDRGEPAYHCLRNHDSGPYPQGRRYRRRPDCADRNTARPHRPRRAVRGRRILYADILRFLRAADYRQETRTL